ncbi:PREDICTED: zinc finger protein 311-like, partial [Rhagoletis zephyria]|uniref:zinc finger protein 311-like n=1 Tax=Rhagoletis zephyria TaxID=28612 RepID=UPI00081158D3
ESESSEDYDEESDEEEEMKDKKQMKIDFRSKDIDVCPPVYEPNKSEIKPQKPTVITIDINDKEFLQFMKTALPAKKNLKNDANEQCDVKKEEDETEKLEDNTDPDYSDGEVEDDESADSDWEENKRKKPKTTKRSTNRKMSTPATKNNTKKAAEKSVVFQHKCEHCEQTFQWPSKLKRHIEVNHSTERKYQCALCPKAFKTSCALGKHQTVHNGMRIHR